MPVQGEGQARVMAFHPGHPARRQLPKDGGADRLHCRGAPVGMIESHFTDKMARAEASQGGEAGFAELEDHREFARFDEEQSVRLVTLPEENFTVGKGNRLQVGRPEAALPLVQSGSRERVIRRGVPGIHQDG